MKCTARVPLKKAWLVILRPNRATGLDDASGGCASRVRCDLPGEDARLWWRAACFKRRRLTVPFLSSLRSLVFCQGVQGASWSYSMGGHSAVVRGSHSREPGRTKWHWRIFYSPTYEYASSLRRAERLVMKLLTRKR